MFRGVDENGSGTITRDEFKRVFDRCHLTVSPEHMQMLVERFDKDGDGTVDASEIVLVLSALGQSYDGQTVDDMIADADVDGSGVIEESEFVAMMARELAGSESDEEDDSGDSDVSDDEPGDGSFKNPVADGVEEYADT